MRADRALTMVRNESGRTRAGGEGSSGCGSQTARLNDVPRKTRRCCFLLCSRAAQGGIPSRIADKRRAQVAQPSACSRAGRSCESMASSLLTYTGVVLAQAEAGRKNLGALEVERDGEFVSLDFLLNPNKLSSVLTCSSDCPQELLVQLSTNPPSTPPPLDPPHRRPAPAAPLLDPPSVRSQPSSHYTPYSPITPACRDSPSKRDASPPAPHPPSSSFPPLTPTPPSPAHATRLPPLVPQLYLLSLPLSTPCRTQEHARNHRRRALGVVIGVLLPSSSHARSEEGN